LAGSEKSASNAERKKEGGYINKSLLTLGTVIAKLSEGKGSVLGTSYAGAPVHKRTLMPCIRPCMRLLLVGCSGHIPYRDSKLTRMLQSSLSGNARVAIVCTMSPSDKAVDESNNTLKFAQRAKNIVVDPRRNAVG